MHSLPPSHLEVLGPSGRSWCRAWWSMVLVPVSWCKSRQRRHGFRTICARGVASLRLARTLRCSQQLPQRESSSSMKDTGDAANTIRCRMFATSHQTVQNSHIQSETSSRHLQDHEKRLHSAIVSTVLVSKTRMHHATKSWNLEATQRLLLPAGTRMLTM